MNPIAPQSDRRWEKARLLKQALAASLIRQHDTSIAPGEFARLGVEDYARVFGEEISERRWRDVFARTCQRAGASADFERVEIYLDEPAGRPPAALAVQPEDESFRELAGQFEAIRRLEKHSLEKRARILDAVFLEYERRLAAGEIAAQARRALCRCLMQHAPEVSDPKSKNPAEALRKTFLNRYDAWLRGNRSLDALSDRRLEPERDLPYGFSPDEWLHLSKCAVKYDNMDLGWREFLESEYARAETRLHFQRDAARNRNRLPRWIQKRISVDVANQQDYQRGPRTAKLNGAFTHRDPNTLASGDSDQSDDKTLDLLWWDDTPTGVWFGQGQLLPWIDERSWLIYNLWLVADNNYNGFDIRDSWSEKVRVHGLPRKQVHVEMGIWKQASVWAGRRSKDEELLGTERAEEGIRRLGIVLRHATLPRGKIIERVLGSMTDLTMGLPGYCGRNQQLEKYEEVQRKARLVRSGQEHPRDLGFLHKSQVIEFLSEIAAKLNRTVKHGEYHQKWIGGRCLHLSPAQAYQEFFSDPLTFIPDEFAHLFQRNTMARQVSAGGVRIAYGQRAFYYNSAELQCFKGREVKCWFNPSDPAVLRVTDREERTRFAVPLDVRRSHDATSAELTEDAQHKAGFDSYHREVHRSLKPAFKEDFIKARFRYPIVDSVTRADNAEILALEADLKTGQTEQRRQQRKETKVLARFGRTMPRSTARRQQAVEGLDALSKMLANGEGDTP